MNFKEWYKKNQKSSNPVDSWRTGQKHACRVSWSACKKEVTKLLQKYKREDWASQADYIEDEIKKL